MFCDCHDHRPVIQDDLAADRPQRNKIFTITGLDFAERASDSTFLRAVYQENVVAKTLGRLHQMR